MMNILKTATQFLGGNSEMEVEVKPKQLGLFANCNFALVTSDKFSADDAEKVRML